MKIGLKIAALALVLFFSDCKKKDNDPAEDPTPTPTPAPAPIDINHAPIAQYDTDNKTYTYQDGGKVAGGMGSGLEIAGSSGTSTAEYSAYFYNTDTEDTYFSIDKGTIYTPGTSHPDTAAFRMFFAPGTVNYSSAVAPAHINGIVIEHKDDSGVMWASDKGSANQTGSVFTIVSSKQVFSFGDQQMKIYATFNCKVYDDNGNSKTLTNGKFVGYFENM
jgi:hypothetical protein